MPSQWDFQPIDGVCFWCERMLAVRLSVLLCDVAAFVQGVDPYAKIARAADWLEHDGLFFKEDQVDFAWLFEVVGSPRELLEATPDDDFVYCGVEDGARRWYLRFRVEWDEPGFELSGDFSLTLTDDLDEGFATRFADHELIREPAAEYFRRITE